MKITRLAVLLALFLEMIPAALAQKADAAFVVGGSFASDSNVLLNPLACPVLLVPCPTTANNLQTGHHVYFEGALAGRLFNAKVASLHLEFVAAGVPSQSLTVTATSPSVAIGSLSSAFFTPALKLKLLPGAPLSPFVSLGGGWAHYALGNGSTNKGALEYGGGLDFKTGIPHLGLRGEVRDFVSGDPNFAFVGGSSTQSGLHRHNVLAGGGVVLSF